jgi:aspartate/methionine/tyrosine aminotransferase
MKPLAAIPQSMPRSGIRELMELAEGLEDVVHLEVGEPDFDTPEAIVASVGRAAQQGFTRYTPTAGLQSLRRAICQRLERDYGRSTTHDEVVVTPGAVAGLTLALIAVLDPGDEVLVPDPGWPNYTSITMLAGGTPVPYLLTRETGYLPDVASLAKLVSPRTKAILINSPGNPTGAVFPERIVRSLLDFATEHDLYVISDEIYEALVFEGEHVPAARFDPFGRTITILGFSKTYAMTGWRLGYAVASPPIAALMTKLQQSTLSCASSISQKAAEAALDMNQDVVAEMRDTYRKRRDLVAGLLGPHLATVPHGAFYALVDVSGVSTDSYEVAKHLLMSRRVATAPGETFGKSGAGLLRISLASATDVLEEGCRRLLAYLESSAK